MNRPGHEGIGSRVGLLALLNALPLGAVAAFLVLRQRGQATMKPLPEGGAGNIVLIALTLATIVALGWAAYPRLRNLREAARRRIRGLWAPFWGAIWLLVAVDLAILGTLVLALFAVEILLLARFALSTR
ncbi:MAG: hypothetical protein ACAI25_15165 [Planctomycetota bacterium]